MKKITEKVGDWEQFEGLNDQEIKTKAEELLNKMTLEEKVNQMAGDKPTFPEIIKMLFHYNKYPYPAGENQRLGIPPIKFTDGPSGVVVGNSTCFPVPMARGASWNIELEEKIGNAIGIEARAQNANFFGGVCINLLRHPAWGRAQETYGEDPYLLGMMGSALVRGTQNHVMACAKHYACNSMENARFKVNVKVDERTLREVYLPHFKICVEQGVASVMNAYNKVNGQYCGHNPHLLRDILKEDWKFQGFVITDFIWGIRDGLKAIQAGVDIEMPFKSKIKPKKVLKWVNQNLVSEALIDDAVLRILKQKIRFAKSERPELYNMNNVVSDEHRHLALQSAEESIVILKNKEILPIDKEKIKKVMVIGELADTPNIGDKGSSRVYPPYIITPLQGIKAKLENDMTIIYDDGSNIEYLKEDIQKADYILIVVGYTHKDEGEYVYSKGGDRDILALKKKDEDLIIKLSELNSKCIVILEGGSAIITENWRKKVSGIIMAWYPGMEGGNAIAGILFGDLNPSGKLPITFPKSEEHAAFPFGFGLSYTRYSYSNLHLNKEDINVGDILMIQIDVKNIGNRSGKEIVQLYIGYEDPSKERPFKELRDFQKVEINPEETKTVTFKLNSKNLAYYDTQREDWVVEKIKYKVLVGPSSKNEELLSSYFTIS
ncbi:MAG: glycoside hydrolase family 3 C-terminal domain-containing protein [Candidatus Lokiarchaeota archaeon]